jgi:RNA polymerase sigma factor (sigma-70 family)
MTTEGASRGAAYDELFRAHRPFLWSLLYRLTGNAADAEDLVQETFVRALARPPARTDEPWRPWLIRVAVNLGRDLLRARRRRGYDGVWLPSPIETPEGEPPSFEPTDPSGNPAARYDLLESVSFAFLLALEALTPSQRAVLLLRDVFDYSVRETARALRLSEANVKTTHGRARRAMEAYDIDRRPSTPDLRARTQETLSRFLACLARGDAAGIEALLAPAARAFTDGGGEFPAALRPIVGRDKVARLYLGGSRRFGADVDVRFRVLNGLPAVIVERADLPPGWAPRAVVQCELDAEGRIGRLYTVVATRKLVGLFGSLEDGGRQSPGL